MTNILSNIDGCSILSLRTCFRMWRGRLWWRRDRCRGARRCRRGSEWRPASCPVPVGCCRWCRQTRPPQSQGQSDTLQTNRTKPRSIRHAANQQGKAKVSQARCKPTEQSQGQSGTLQTNRTKPRSIRHAANQQSKAKVNQARWKSSG